MSRVLGCATGASRTTASRYAACAPIPQRRKVAGRQAAAKDKLSYRGIAGGLELTRLFVKKNAKTLDAFFTFVYTIQQVVYTKEGVYAVVMRHFFENFGIFFKIWY
ncbi:MAG: hypothetical protein LBG15_13455 [Dysgonamonadaceae bacterium]|jgi:hypothetical protein|nr:hypothetical protein [Dysgonamonadaceae bacterium]